jgi:hypothetical protein
VQRARAERAGGAQLTAQEAVATLMAVNKATVPFLRRLRRQLSGESEAGTPNEDTARRTWLHGFIAARGHTYLMALWRTEVKTLMDAQQPGAAPVASELLAECCRCVRSLLNTQEGLATLLATNASPAAAEVVDSLVVSLLFVNVRTQALVLVTLAALALVSALCHRALVQGLATRERQALLKALVKSKEAELACACLLLINAVVNQVENAATRIAVRDLFLKHMLLRSAPPLRSLTPAQEAAAAPAR